MIRVITIIAVFFVFTSSAWAADRDMPKKRHVKVTSGITEVVIDIYPTLGVKCIFPWVLSESSKDLPFSHTLINGDVFKLVENKGQNYILFHIDVKGGNIENALSDVFVNVAGYHFVFKLRATFNDRKHYSTIVFDLGEAEKLDLIERSIQRRMVSLRKEFDTKEKELDKRANMLAMKLVGRMAMGKPKIKRIKTDNSKKMTNGDKLVFYCDRLIDYGSIFVIPIEIENRSGIQPLYVQNIGLEKTSKSGDVVPIVSEFEVKEVKLAPDQKTTGFIVSENSLISERGDAKCTLFTDRGNVEVEW